MPPLDNAFPRQPHPWEKSYPKGLRWDDEIPEITMVDLFDTAVAKYKDRTCLNFMDQKYSFEEVGHMVDRFARGLQDQGIVKGSKVGLCLPNTPFYVIAYYAALKAGATVVNFNPLYGEKEMADQIRDSDADMMITLNLEQIFPKVGNMLGKASLKKIVVCDMADALPAKKAVGFRALNTLTGLTKYVPFLGKKVAELRDKNGVQPVSKIRKDKNLLSYKKLLESKGPLKPVEIHPDNLAVLQYTGGTTGVPKAAMLSHGNLSANAQQAALWFGGAGKPGQPEKSLAVLPFFHVFSMAVQMNLPIHIGAENVMLPKFEIKETLETITKNKPTIFAGVPTIYQKILKCKTLDKYDLSSLKVCISGGAPLPTETLKEFKDKTGIDLIEGYGLSESGAVTANPINGVKKPGSIGLPLPGVKVKLVPLSLPDANTPVHVEAKEGEILLGGPSGMAGYWKRDDETQKSMKDGYFRTGDIGRIDDDGYLYIIGRLKEMIIVKGFKAFPFKIEEAILAQGAIDQAAVIGVPRKDGGEDVKAFIVLKEGKTVTDEELAAFLKDHLADYEMPKMIERRKELPLTLIGKPDKKVLKAEQAAADAKAAAEKTKPPAPKKNGPQV